VTPAFDALKERLEEVKTLYQIESLLEWDMQTQMPSGGAKARARHLSVLSKLTHQLYTQPDTGAMIDSAATEVHGADYSSFEASLVRVAERDYEQAVKLPTELVTELARATTEAHESWVNARKNNDFKAFVPILERIFELKRRVADKYGYTDHPYDALLNEYEPGLTTKDVAGMFDTLRTDLVPLVKAISENTDRVSDEVLHRDYDEAKQRDFAEMVVARFGYDFARGRQDRAVHPFAISFSRNDVRITTRYHRDWLNPALFGTLHESGHAMYEQGVGEELEGTPLARGASLGVHESQSRLWENVIGRSRGFWTYFYPQLQAAFPDQLGSVPLDTFYRAINKVEPSFIRVEADEATYNLHIMVRFEIERELIAGTLKVADLRDVWNAKYQEYLGITPPTDALGVLQDVHWSMGLVGYFPTYSIGNLLSVQLYEKALETYPGIPDEIARGEFTSLLRWMRENIHVHGRKFLPQELITRVTGEPMQSRSYVRYLKTKYSEIYGL
jgi:carboxypeptidase Taq